MATAVETEMRMQSLRDPEIKAQLQALRKTDNITNLFYLVRTYLFLSVVIGVTIWFFHARVELGLHWLWNLPVSILAIILVGAGQHQLTGLAHEASHHILFRNRVFNDLVSDWFCMFPMFSCTQHYRLQHLAHHQFVNDPDRDPDVSQLQTSGHWLNFPLQKKVFLLTLLKQLWIPNLIRFIRIRAAYNSFPTDKNPYMKKDWKPSRLAIRVGLFYILGQVAMLTTLVIGVLNYEWPLWTLAVLPLVAYASVMVFYATIPDRMYHQSRVHPTISMRTMTLNRITFITGLFYTLAWLSATVDVYAAGYFLLLWAVPIFTSFSFFMILRQLVQHGNGDRGWLTNTRVFGVNYLINFAVFPMGQDYHLPHHMFASIPHYRLRQLHDVLMQCDEYRKEAVVVDGYFIHRHNPPIGPTVLDVLGPDFHHRAEEIYIDNDVLEGVEVEDRDEIIQQGELEKQKRRAEFQGSNS